MGPSRPIRKRYRIYEREYLGKDAYENGMQVHCIKRHAFWGGSVLSLDASLPPLARARNWSPSLTKADCLVRPPIHHMGHQNSLS